MEPTFNLTVLPQEGYWTHNEQSEGGTFVGSVQLLISPVASDHFPTPVLPLTFPVRLTVPLIPGYAWVGVNPPPHGDVVPFSPPPSEIPLSAYPPYDPVTRYGFLLPGVPIDWSKGAREDTPPASGGDVPAVPSSPVVEAAAVVVSEEEEEEDPSEGSPQ